MADQLYLSLWFPNFRLETLPGALTAVMRQFGLIAGPEGKRVHAAAAYPISFSEPAVYQRLYVVDPRAEENRNTEDSIIENAVADATEQLHDDMAYEFEMKWRLWTPDSGPGSLDFEAEDAPLEPGSRLDPLWKQEPATVRILGFGPHFDSSAFQQNGHVRVDFGLDYPWVLDDTAEDEHASDDADDADDVATEDEATPSNLIAFAPRTGGAGEIEPPDAAQYIQRNVEMLLAFTLSVEKNCGISSRLLWTESGEPLAEKLIARLQRLN